MCLSPRESGHFISSHAKHVQIHDEGVVKCSQEILRRLRTKEISLEALYKKTEIHPQQADDKSIDWVFFTTTLNFSFWNGDGDPKYQVTYKGKTYTGYMSLVAALGRTLDLDVPLTSPDFYGKISEEKLNEYLLGDNGVPCPLLKDRLRCLHEVAKVLDEKFGGTFVNCLKQAEGSAQKLIALVLDSFPCFRDVATYNGKKVSLLKRAQILVSDIWALFEGKGLGHFDDIDSLTMFADYRVPQSLQYFGVMTYTPELIEALNTGLLENGSELEVEIRGCSIEAVERIVTEVKKMIVDEKEAELHFVNAALVDYFLWGFRREIAEEMEAFPYHKTRSVFY